MDERRSNNFGRRAAQVACRSLGFSSGAQILSGTFSALPGPSGEADTGSRIECQGDEVTLADCEFPPGSYNDYGGYDERELSAVAIVCTSPSGIPLYVFSRSPHTVHTWQNSGAWSVQSWS